MSDMTPEQMREYNIKAAKELGLYYSEDDGVIFINESNPMQFDFFTNAADREMLIEKLEIMVWPTYENFSDVLDGWKAICNLSAPSIIIEHKKRKTAIITCIVDWFRLTGDRCD